MWAFVRHCGFTLVVGWLACQSASAQDVNVLPDEYPIWQSPEGFDTQAYVVLMGLGTGSGLTGNLPSIPMGFLAIGESRQHENWRVVFDRVINLPAKPLRMIRDGRPIPSVLRKELGRDVKGPDLAWYGTFTWALNYTRITPLKNFERSGEPYEHVTYAHLKAKPWQYRGKIITVTGKLRVLRKEDAPRHADGAVKTIYYGWIIGPTERAPPFTIAITELPDGIEKENEKLNRKVTFRGYFLSFVRFPADKGAWRPQKDVISPYLVGKISDVQAAPVADDAGSPYSAALFGTMLGAIFVVGLILVGLNYWLRRGDRLMQERLAQMRERHSPFNIEPADEPPPAATPEDTKS